MWDPDGHMILLSFSESSSLGSIHFASKPPSLGIYFIFNLHLFYFIDAYLMILILEFGLCLFLVTYNLSNRV